MVGTNYLVVHSCVLIREVVPHREHDVLLVLEERQLFRNPGLEQFQLKMKARTTFLFLKFFLIGLLGLHYLYRVVEIVVLDVGIVVYGFPVQAPHVVAESPRCGVVVLEGTREDGRRFVVGSRTCGPYGLKEKKGLGI